MTLHDWLANHSELRSEQRGLTLGEALARGDDEAIADILSRPVYDLAVSRGRIPIVEFAADWTPEMDDGLSDVERRVLTTVWLAADEIDLDGPAIAPIMQRVGFPTMRPASAAEVFFGRERLAASEIPTLDLIPRIRHVSEHLTVDADGTIYHETRDDGHVRQRTPVRDRHGIPLHADPDLLARAVAGAVTEGALHRWIREGTT